MIPVINDIDQLLQAAEVRILNPSNAGIRLAPSAPGFHVTAAGEVDISVVRVDAELTGLEGEVIFSVQGATLSNATARSVDVNYAGGVAIVTAVVVSAGVAFDGSCIIPVLRDGSAGNSSFVWIKYADGPNGEGLSNLPDGKTYIAIAQNKLTATESNDPADYSYALIKGSDGSSLRMWIKYSDNADGSGMYDDPTETTMYIGIAVNKSNPLESTNPADYTWSRFRGGDGVSVPGSRGAGFYRTTGSAWSDGVADAVTPGGNVVGDIVTISNGVVSYTKEWDGNSWEFPGAFLPGNLLVEKSIFAAQLAVDAVTSEKIKAGAVDAEKIAAGAIVASKFSTSGELTNLIRDSRFKDLAWWGVAGRNVSVGDWGTDHQTWWKDNASLYFYSTGNAMHEAWTANIPVQPGTTYHVEYQISFSGDFDGDVTIEWYMPWVNWYGFGVSSSGYTWPSDGGPIHYPSNSRGSRQVVDQITTSTDPRGVNTAIRIRYRVSAGSFEVGGFRIIRKVDGTTIKDGSIETKHLTIAQGGNIRSGQTGYGEGDGFFIEGAGNGHGARMSLGRQTGRQLLCDPENNVLGLFGATINNAAITSAFSVSIDEINSLGNLTTEPAVMGSGAHISAGSGSYDYLWSFSAGSPFLSLISAPNADSAIIRCTANGGWHYGNLTLTLRDRNTGMAASASGYVRVQMGSGAEP